MKHPTNPKHFQTKIRIGSITKDQINNSKVNYKYESKIKKREEKEKNAQPKIVPESFDRKPDMKSLQSLPLPLYL